jgi:hypothetical protein
VLLSAQTKGQLELDVILGAAGRGLRERECEGWGRGSKNQSHRQRQAKKGMGQVDEQVHKEPGLDKAKKESSTGSPVRNWKREKQSTRWPRAEPPPEKRVGTGSEDQEEPERTESE